MVGIDVELKRCEAERKAEKVTTVSNAREMKGERECKHGDERTSPSLSFSPFFGHLQSFISSCFDGTFKILFFV